jgi:hypothetical protein
VKQQNWNDTYKQSIIIKHTSFLTIENRVGWVADDLKKI